MKKTILGSGIYNYDIIVVRDYPEWPRLRPFNDENVVLEEVGDTGSLRWNLPEEALRFDDLSEPEVKR